MIVDGLLVEFCRRVVLLHVFEMCGIIIAMVGTLQHQNTEQPNVRITNKSIAKRQAYGLIPRMHRKAVLPSHSLNCSQSTFLLLQSKQFLTFGSASAASLNQFKASSWSCNIWNAFAELDSQGAHQIFDYCCCTCTGDCRTKKWTQSLMMFWQDSNTPKTKVTTRPQTLVTFWTLANSSDFFPTMMQSSYSFSHISLWTTSTCMPTSPRTLSSTWILKRSKTPES